MYTTVLYHIQGDMVYVYHHSKRFVGKIIQARNKLNKSLPPCKEWPLFDRQCRPRLIVRDWTAQRKIQKSSELYNTTYM